MAQQVLDNNVLKSVQRGKINDNFTELYSQITPNFIAAPNTDITTALQAAISNTSNSVVAIVRPGVYTISPNVVNPYQAGTRACVDIDRNNLAIYLGPGVELRLAPNSQTNANGAVYGFVARSKTGIRTFGPGRLNMNSLNQSGWTSGYNQEAGGGIRGYHVANTSGNRDWIVSDWTIENTFGNPVNVYDDSKATGLDSDVYFRNLRCVNFGEGLQIIGAKLCGVFNCQLRDPLNNTVGDAFEFSVCNGFHAIGNSLIGGGTLAGSAFDCYSSREGVIIGNVVNGWNNAIGTTRAIGEQRVQNVRVVGNHFVNLRNGYASDDCEIYFTDNTWKNITEFPVFQVFGPVRDTCTITRSGSVATATVANHGYVTGDKVWILGANQPEYNGLRTITGVPSSTTFTYAVTGTPVTPATGTIRAKAHRALIVHSGDTIDNCSPPVIKNDAEFSFKDGHIINCTGGGIKLAGTTTGVQGMKVTISGNLIRDNGNVAIECASEDGSAFAPPARLINNTFERNGTSGTNVLAGANLGLTTNVFRRGNVGITDTRFALSDVQGFDCLWDASIGLWQDAGVTGASNNDPVLQWRSSQGSARTLAAPNNGARPTRHASGGIFGGAGKYLSLAGLNLPGPYTILVKIRTLNVTGGNIPYLAVDTGAGKVFLGAFQTFPFQYFADGDSARVDIVPTPYNSDVVGGYSIAANGDTLLYAPDQSIMSGEGSSAGSPRSGSSTLYVLDFGAATGSSAADATVPLLKVALFNRVLTAAELPAIYEELMK